MGSGVWHDILLSSVFNYWKHDNTQLHIYYLYFFSFSHYFFNNNSYNEINKIEIESSRLNNIILFQVNLSMYLCLLMIDRSIIVLLSIYFSFKAFIESTLFLMLTSCTMFLYYFLWKFHSCYGYYVFGEKGRRRSILNKVILLTSCCFVIQSFELWYMIHFEIYCYYHTP